MTTWTIDELVAAAVRTLAASGGVLPASRRVREIPDVRTVRYYVSLGLIDRPLEMRGRTARYGRRHLLQILAIKKLQSEGMPLVEIQGRLVGATDRTLERLAGPVSEAAGPVSEAAGSPRAGRPARAREPFWKAPPAARTTRSVPAPRARTAVHLDLARGVTLVLDGVDPVRIQPEKLTRIAGLAQPILVELRQLGLDSPQREEDS